MNVVTNSKDNLFYQLVNLFNNISDIEDEYYKNIEKEKLFQLISFAIFRDDVFEIISYLLSNHKAIISKRFDNIFEDNYEYKEEIEKFDRLKKELFRLSGYQFMETKNTLFDIYHLFEFNGNDFKIVYKPVKAFLDWSKNSIIEAINYSNIPFSYRNKKIKILKTYLNLPDEINKQTYKLISKIGSDKQKHLSIKDVKCTDLKKKLTILYLFKQIQKDYPNHKKQEHIAILINKLKQLNKELKIDLIKKCKILRVKFERKAIYEEAKLLYKEMSYPINEKYIWEELNKYDKAINFYNESEK